MADGVLMDIKMLIESTVDDPEDLPERILDKVDAYFGGRSKMTSDAESPEPRGTLYEQAVERGRKQREERPDPSRCSFCKGTGIAYWGASNPPTPVMCQPCGGTGQGTRDGFVAKRAELPKPTWDF